jgi:RNA polymerase sigma-70 factor (ECF subfamily)
MPTFEYDGSLGFRKWLWTVTRNKLFERQRRIRPTVPMTDEPLAVDPGPDALDEADFRRHLLGQVLPSFQEQFHPTTWAAFWGHVVEGRPVPEVAAELGVTISAVYKAKVRVIARLHEQLPDLFGIES